jgi:hypothetical protein
MATKKKASGMKKTYTKDKMWEEVLADWDKKDEKAKKSKKK